MKVPISTCRIGRTPDLKQKSIITNFDKMTASQKRAVKSFAYLNLVGENRKNVGAKKRTQRNPNKHNNSEFLKKYSGTCW